MSQDSKECPSVLAQLTTLLDEYRQGLVVQDGIVETLKTLLWNEKNVRAKLGTVLVKCDPRHRPKVLYVCTACGGFTVDAQSDACCNCDRGYEKYDVLPHGSTIALRALTTYWRDSSAHADGERMRLLNYRVTNALRVVDLRKWKARTRRRLFGKRESDAVSFSR